MRPFRRALFNRRRRRKTEPTPAAQIAAYLLKNPKSSAPQRRTHRLIENAPSRRRLCQETAQLSCSAGKNFFPRSHLQTAWQGHKSAIKNAEQGWKQCKTEARNLQNAQKRRRFAGAVFESYGKRQRPGPFVSMRSKEQGRAWVRMEKKGKNRPCRHGSANSKIQQRTSLHRGLFSLPVRQCAQTKAKSLRACSTICARPYNYNNPCEEKGRESV